MDRLELVYPGSLSNAEALLFDPVLKELVVVTKEESIARFFTLPAAARADHGPHELTLIGSVPFEGVSGGDIAPAGDEIVIRREDRAELGVRRPGQSLAEALRLPGREIPVMTPPVEGNGEALAFAPDGGGHYTVGEKKGAPIFYFRRLGSERQFRGAHRFLGGAGSLAGRS